MRRRPLLCVLLLALALPASATVHEPEVTLVGVGDRPVLVPGEAYEFPVDVILPAGGHLESIRMAGDPDVPSAILETRTAVTGAPVPEGYQRLTVMVRGIHEAGTNPRLRARVDGVWHDLEVDLFDGADRTMERTPPPYEPERISLSGLAAPLPADPGILSDPEAASATARSVWVHGRITMTVRKGSDGNPDEIQGVDGVTVRAIQHFTLLDDVTLGSGVTDANGDFGFRATVDGTIDVRIEVVTKNGSAVNVGNGTFFSTYARWFHTEWDFAGTTIDVGTENFGLDDFLNPPMFIATTITRAHRWFLANGISPGRVSVHFPDDGSKTSFYSRNPGSEGIHLRTDSGRNGGTILHEYGHHWVGNRAASRPPSYCNDMCDEESCGHCFWCEETDGVAWSEGFASFIAWWLGKDHIDNYGWELPDRYVVEWIGMCGSSGYDPPDITEGYLSTLCRDLVDLDNENDLSIDSFSADRTSFDPMLPFEVAMERRPETSLEFVRAFHEELLERPGITPADLSDFWSTVRNNGLADDSTPPTAPTFAYSPTHQIGVPSPNSQPSFQFSGGTDDYTGVQSYYVDIHTSPREPQSGGEYLAVGSEVWTGHLAPGTWYANVRSVDGADNESLDWITYGPFIVADPVPLDLTPAVDLFWEAPLIVRNAPDAVSGAVGWQPNLLASDMYLNLLFKNDSPGSAVVGDFSVVFALDGVVIHTETMPGGNIGAGQIFQLLNLGPFTLPAGRHTISCFVDQGRTIGETVETNNQTGVVVVADPTPITPANLGSTVRVAMPFPGDPRGGQPGLGFDPQNRGAVVFTPSTRYTLLSARPDAFRAGLGLHAYEPHPDPFTGLESQIGSTAYSSNNSLVTHMVIDRDLFPSSTAEIGVSYGNPGEGGGYWIEATNAFAFNLSPTAPTVLNPTLTEDMDALAIEINVDPSALGYLHMRLEATFSRAPDRKSLYAYWIPPGEPVPFTSNMTPSVRTVGLEAGTATLDIPVAGKYLLVIMKSGFYSVGPVSVDANLRLERVPRPELRLPEVDPIWDFSMVPLPSYTQDDTLSFPAVLLGDVSSTFINFSMVNTGDLDAPIAPAELTFQGEPLLQLDLGPIPAGGRAEYRSPNPINIPGGRRTLSVTVDPYFEVDEMDEGNNTFAVQYGWRGPTLLPQSLTRPAPPDPNLDRNEVEELLRDNLDGDAERGAESRVTQWAPNCDGLLLDPAVLTNGDGTWIGAAIAPTTLESHDLRLYDGTLDPRLAFTRPLATSSWGFGETDFVLVSGALSQLFDLGIVATNGDDPYKAYATRSTYLGTPPDGLSTFGTYSLAAGDLLGLGEFQLEPGTYTINLQNQSAVHLGMSIHAPLSRNLTNFHGKDELLEQGPNGWANGPGQGQTTTFTVEEGEQGRWCVAVWRQGYTDGAVAAYFNLDFDVQLDAPAPVSVDGYLDPVAYGYNIVLQGISTAFGDNDEPRLDLANGSELDGAYALIENGMLYLMLTGNLESNGNDLEVFLDTRPGGMNRLIGGLGDVPGGAIARMGDDGSGNGLTFDLGFEADYYLTVSGIQRGLTEDRDPYLLDVLMAELTPQGVDGEYLGSTYAAQRGRLYGQGSGEAGAGNLLVNPGFEDPALGGPDSFGAGNGWTTFGGGVYTVTDAFAPPHSGAQSLKLFGSCCSGAYQQFPTEPGEVWNGGVWIYNNVSDPLAGGQVAAVNIEWIQADGTTQSAILPFVSNGATDADTPQGQWTYRTIRGAAPDDAAFARFTLITGDFAAGGPGGAPFYDDAVFLRETPTPAEDTPLNPFGILAAINNANLAGVGAGTGVDSGSGADTGVEFGIPLAAIGNPEGCVRISAFLNGAQHDFVSNQTLGPLPAGTDVLGEPRDVDFGDHPGNQYFEVCPEGTIGIEDSPTPVPVGAVLHAPSPNPFRPQTSLSFTLDRSGPVDLTIHDAAGRQVRRIHGGKVLAAGLHEVIWDGLDEGGRRLASGVYFARLRAAGTVSTQRLVLLR